MFHLSKRLMLFLFGCIPFRLFLSYIIYIFQFHTFTYIDINMFINIFALLLLIISLGFIIIFIFKLRKTGLETGGCEIWWDHLRPIHSILYLMASYYLFERKFNMASLILLLDTLMGLVSFTFYHDLFTKYMSKGMI